MGIPRAETPSDSRLHGAETTKLNHSICRRKPGSTRGSNPATVPGQDLVQHSLSAGLGLHLVPRENFGGTGEGAGLTQGEGAGHFSCLMSLCRVPQSQEAACPAASLLVSGHWASKRIISHLYSDAAGSPSLSTF